MRRPRSRSSASTTPLPACGCSGGSVAARLRNPQSLGEFEMTTDEGRFRVQAVGRYRFDRFDQASDVTVFNGQAIYEAPRHRAAGDDRPARAVLDRLAPACRSTRCWQPARDAFAGWNDERDRAEDRIVTASTALRLARDDRRRGPRPLRQLGADTRIRQPLDPALGAGRLGAVQRRATGRGCARGAGPGSTTRPGASRRSTTAAGSTTATSGAGRRARTSRGRSTRRRWSHGSAGRASASRSRSAAAVRRSAGSRSRRARSTCPRTGRARAMCARSTSRTSPTSPTSRPSSTTATARPTGATSRTASTRMR